MFSHKNIRFLIKKKTLFADVLRVRIKFLKSGFHILSNQSEPICFGKILRRYCERIIVATGWVESFIISLINTNK